MEEITLASGRKVLIKSMTVDDIDECRDIPKLEYRDGETTTIRNVYKARTAWLRHGIGGGDFEDYVEINDKASDSAIKELEENEVEELVQAIQEAQRLGKKRPSSSP